MLIPALLPGKYSEQYGAKLWILIGGFSIQHTVDRHDYYVGPWRGLAVTAAYAVVALVLGLIVTRRRDI